MAKNTCTHPVTIYPLAGPHNLNLLNQLMAIRSSSSFSRLRPGAFHIALQTHKAQHTKPRGWMKRRTNKHGFGFAPTARRAKFVTLLCGFLCIWLSRACIRAKFLHIQQKRWLILSRCLTWLLSPQVPTPLTVAFPRLLLTAFSVDCFHLLTALGPCLLSSSSGLVGNLALKPFVWVSRQNRQRNPLTGTHSHPQNECTQIVPHTHNPGKKITVELP